MTSPFDPTVRTFLRISVHAPKRNADVVIPAQQCPAETMPELLAILDHPADGTATGQWKLVTALGSPVADDVPWAESGLADGAQLWLVVSDQAPPPPAVLDVPDALADHPVAGRWTAETARSASTAVGAILLLAGLLHALSTLSARSIPLALGVIGILWCLALGLNIARLRILAKGIATAAVAAGVLIMLHPAPFTGTSAGQPPALVGWVVVGVLALLTAGLWRQASGAAVIAAVLLSGLAGAYALLAAGAGSSDRAAGVLIILTVAILGQLPRVALARAGVLRQADAVGRGEQVSRSSVRSAVDRAHRTLSLSVAVIALVAALGDIGLAGSRSGWLLAFGALASIVLALRSRHFPQAAQRAMLWLAAAAFPAALLVLRTPVAPGYAVILPALALVVGASGYLKPPEALAAQLRLWGTRIETTALVGMVPVLVGSFGVYGQLLRSFGGPS